ncbi:M10 family metallopeptidase C-terminal domain-containing protein [Ensifer soli]|uniref:M10 family metallopeptidase C-terminal domain-containing protein n=1 Tax=Ciceribacter sp. sgz301302 TaxID=3342379 RepID=UPI0035B7E0BD
MALKNGTVTVKAPPSKLSGGGFYKYYVDAGGIPILGSRQVDKAAFQLAYNIVVDMLQGNDQLLKALVRNGAKIGIIAEGERLTQLPDYRDLYSRFPGTDWDSYAGVGGVLGRPMSSTSEANLLKLPSDPYGGMESILVHEFGHGVMNLAVDTGAGAAREIDRAFANARAKGLWEGLYAMTNRQEYWAEMTQRYFNVERDKAYFPGQPDTRTELRSYDPLAYALMRKYYGDTDVETLAGTDLDDVITASRYDDVVDARAGKDKVMTGKGNDLLSGGDGNDTLIGGEGRDVLKGGNGRDILRGDAGDDRLSGDLGADKLTGGRGADVFVFGDAAASTPLETDLIVDFRRAEKDRIDLRGIDADLTLSGDQAFDPIGYKVFSGAAGELRFSRQSGKTLVEGDLDGDGVADISLMLNGTAVLRTADFFL